MAGFFKNIFGGGAKAAKQEALLSDKDLVGMPFDELMTIYSDSVEIREYLTMA